MTGERTFGQWWQHEGAFVDADFASIGRFGRECYRRAGASEDDADFLFGMNLDKALQGDHTRGLGRVPGVIRSALAGRLDLRPELEVVRDSPSATLIDCERTASGRLACRRGMEMAIDKARGRGIAFSGVRAQAELLTRFVRMAVDREMIGIVFNQSFPTVAATGGAGPMLGNQPLAIGIPAQRHDPVLLDMSLTQSSAAGMFLAARQRQSVAPGLLLDEHGAPTTDASCFATEQIFPGLGPGALGSLTPLGGSHKGYALIFVFSLLTSVLTDTDPSWKLFYHLAERGRYGTVLIAIDPAVILPFADFAARVDDFIDTVKASPRREGVDEILYPGEGSQRLRRLVEQSGRLRIPLADFDDLVALAAEMGIEAPIRLDG